jgi:cell division protein FtsA
MAEKIVTGLDIGSTAIRVAVGQLLPSEAADRVHLIAAVSVPANGISRGSIVSVEEAVTSISTAIEAAERIAGVPIESAYVSVSAAHAVSQTSRGVIGVSRSDGEIRAEDVERAVDAARMVATPANYEILHVLPKSYVVDGQIGVRDPVGMTGIRLEVESLIIQGLAAHLRNLTKCVHRTGIEIDALVLGPLAASEAVTNARERDLGVGVVTIGASSSSFAVYEGGDVLCVGSVPIGAEHITSDIAIGLRTSLDVAEKVKTGFGVASSKDISKKEEISLSELGAPEDERVSRKYVAEIIEARAEEICEKIDRELRRIDRSGMLPAGVIITGGGAKLAGMTDVAKRVLRLPATVGYPVGISSITDKSADAAFSTAVGLVLWGSQSAAAAEERGSGGLMGKIGGIGGIGKGVKKLFKSFMP